MDQQTYQINPNIMGQSGQPRSLPPNPMQPGMAAPNPMMSGAANPMQPSVQMQTDAQPGIQSQPVTTNWNAQAGMTESTAAMQTQGMATEMPPSVQPVEQAVAPQVIMPQGTAGNLSAANLGAAAVKANQASPVSPNKELPTSTQATLLISELRDNVVIMKDGSFRAVVACKSINFDLMSDVEREGVEYSYQNFLNSLKFSVQILIRSQRVDIGPYIERLNEIRRNNDNMLLGVLMDDYINFIDILSQEANIMDKAFFIVVPYYTSEDAEKLVEQTRSIFKAFSKQKSTGITRINRETYNKALSELTNRVDAVMSGLFQIGIHSVRLNTKELAELYYNYNNPDTAVREPLVDFSKLATMYVRKGENNG